MRKVIFVRWIGPESGGQFYARRAELPVAPFENLGVMVNGDEPPVAIQDVFVNRSGDVVCVLPGHVHAPGAPPEWVAEVWHPAGEEPCFTSEKVPYPPKRRPALGDVAGRQSAEPPDFPTL